MSDPIGDFLHELKEFTDKQQVDAFMAEKEMMSLESMVDSMGLPSDISIEVLDESKDIAAEKALIGRLQARTRRVSTPAIDASNLRIQAYRETLKDLLRGVSPY